MSGLLLIAVSVVLVVVVLRASLGRGAQRRTLGFHVPGIHRDAAVWIAAHRAARWVTAPCCALAAILGIVALAGAGVIASAGWVVWAAGLLGGAAIALTVSLRRRT